MSKINLYEALLMEQKEKDDFYRDTLYGELDWFISETVDKKLCKHNRIITKKDYLERLRILIDKAEDIYEKLVPKYDRYVENFNLKKVVPIKNVRYEDFKIVQNLSNFDLLDYADFIKLGGNTPKRLLFNLNTMNPKQSELTMYIRFINSLLLHTRINYIHDLKSKGFDLFVALNDDIDGLFLQVTTDWYLIFFDEDEFKAKWKAFKKLRIADYITASCLDLKKAKVFMKKKIELKEREAPLINKDLLFKFKDNKDEKILFQKRWITCCNSMFWSSPDRMEMPIENIITIALNNNSSFLTFLDLYLLFGANLMIYVDSIYQKLNGKIFKKYHEFYEMCYDIFRFSSKNYKNLVLKKQPILEQSFIKLIYSKLFNVAFEDANEGFPIQLLYSKAKAENNKVIEREIKEYISNCFVWDLQYIDKSR